MGGIAKFMKSRSGYADAGPVVLNDESLRTMTDAPGFSAGTFETTNQAFQRANPNYIPPPSSWTAMKQKPLAAAPMGLVDQETAVQPQAPLGVNKLTTSLDGTQFAGKDYNLSKPDRFNLDPRKRLGLAQGGTTVGFIKGKVNPNVADDTTITTPSGIEINAKKGEFVLSVDDVENLGGPEKVEAMVKKLRTLNGQPTEMGPKSTGEPDNYGRMDKEGMADGGSLWDTYKQSNAASNRELARNFRGVPTPRKQVVNVPAEEEAAPENTFREDIWNPLKVAGSGVLSYLGASEGKEYDAALKAKQAAPATRLARSTPDITFAATTTPAARPDMTADEMTKIALSKTPNLGISDRRGPSTTPEQDEALGIKTLAEREAGYKASAAEQDRWTEDLRRRERLEKMGRLFADNLEAQKQARLKMNTQDWTGGSAGQRAQARYELETLQAEAALINEQSRQASGLEGTRTAAEEGRKGHEFTATEGRKGREFAATEGRKGREFEAVQKALYTPSKAEAAKIAAEGKKELAAQQAEAKISLAGTTAYNEYLKANPSDIEGAQIAARGAQEAARGSVMVTPGMPKVDAKKGKYWWSEDTEARRAVSPTYAPAGRDAEIATARMLLAKYGDRAKAEAAYKNGER